MTSKIPTIYTDKFGSVDTEIINDFKTLILTIEGTKFVSRNFDDFAPIDKDYLPSRFKLNHFKELTDCSLLCEIPMIACRHDKEVSATLIVEIHLDASESLYNTYSSFSLLIENGLIEIGKAQHFESAFEILKSKLPSDTYLKCCYNCLYADYSFAGSAIFGTMFCFKNIKEKYLAVRTKDEYMEIMNLCDRQVQEVYLSESFEPRIKGTGYRG